MPSFSLSPAELDFLHSSLSLQPPIRPDSRGSTDFRPLSAETDILPAANGSAHLSFADGSEAIVGVKAEVEKTINRSKVNSDHGNSAPEKPSSSPSWISLTITLPNLRDDEPSLSFLSSTLLEPLLASGLTDALPINKNWHWHLCVDILLLSPYGLTSYPVPLLSLTTHLALLSTRLPKLKSEGEEDPLFEDDWERSTYLYERANKGKAKGRKGLRLGLPRPPVTLLVMAVGENVLFDPSREELAVADGVFAVSVAETTSDVGGNEAGQPGPSLRIISVRTVDSPARDTMKGVPISGESTEGVDVPGVWKPKIGGLKRSILRDIIRIIVGSDGQPSVAREVLDGVAGFIKMETASG